MGDISDNFSRYEFACKCGCGFATADIELVHVLEDMRNHFGEAITINSPCRCREHNEAVQKKYNSNYVPYSSTSKHMLGNAVDAVVANVSSREVYTYLCSMYPDKYGIGYYDDRVHLDTRIRKARW